MRSAVISGISPNFPELSQSQGQVAHVLLTRSPLIPHRSRFTVRLACVKHTASVRPEPGSNSPLMSNQQPPPARNQQKPLSTREIKTWPKTPPPKKGEAINQRNPRHNQPHGRPCQRGKSGIDFWHAVEFSRSGRTPIRN